MATETITISIPGGPAEIEGENYVSNIDDTQYVTLTDGGSITSLSLEKFGRGTPTEAGEGPGGDDVFILDLSEFNDDFTITVKSMDAGDTFDISGALSSSNVGNVYTINYIGSDGLTHTVVIDVESTNGTGVAGIVITCFAEGVMIETGEGLTAVQDLAVGDAVLCGDGELRPARWVSKRIVTEAEMNSHPEFRPIRIRKDALAENVPNADLVVSPQHRVLVNDWRAELMFGEEEVLVPAVHMINDRDILRDYNINEVTYYHFMFDSHHTVWSNGMETESFFPGDEAIDGVGKAGRAELFKLFPELEDAPASYGPTCRPTLKAHEAHAMLGAGSGY